MFFHLHVMLRFLPVTAVSLASPLAPLKRDKTLFASPGRADLPCHNPRQR